ncbi:glycosyltransferase family 39 protein [Adhaeribacter aerolatus]|uniref:glycosyltransferase family 39 protein n=1 Tax=Adhaeribacter aerolatus TaxID=670289 RepID=UPI0011BF3953|nr:glycosyltransferase family 39 protein [Adhaeribacter aerolatus]
MKSLTLRTKKTNSDFQQITGATRNTKANGLLSLSISALLAIGIFLRVFHFVDNRSLWIDEIYLATSLIKMNFGELLAPYLDYEQKAPVGFLWLVRACVMLFGTNEMALRLMPLLTGIASLFLFLPVARYFLKPMGVAVALGILALAPPLVYHAVEIKQYGFELFAAILVLYLYIRYQQKTDYGSLLFWGVAGAIIIWFSYTSIFLLAGMGIGLGLYYLLKRNWPAFFRTVIPATLWLLSFAVNYFLFTYKHAGSEWLTIWFRTYDGFMPFPPTSAADLGWFVQKIFSTLHYPLGLSWYSLHFEYNALLRILARMAWLPLIFLVVGLYGFFKHDKKVFLVMVLPFGLHLFASGLELYPFFDRLTVYLAPILILFIARGCQQLVEILPVRQRFWQYALPILLLTGPLVNSLRQVINPALFGDYKKSYQREALLYINEHYKPGDTVYVYWNTWPAYNFYKNAYGLKFDAIIGKDVRNISGSYEEYFANLRPDFEALAGKKRVWVVYNKFAMNKIGDIEGHPAWYYNDKRRTLDMIQATFDAKGRKLDSYEAIDMQVNLYDMLDK